MVGVIPPTRTPMAAEFESLLAHAVCWCWTGFVCRLSDRSISKVSPRGCVFTATSCPLMHFHSSHVVRELNKSSVQATTEWAQWELWLGDISLSTPEQMCRLLEGEARGDLLPVAVLPRRSTEGSCSLSPTLSSALTPPAAKPHAAGRAALVSEHRGVTENVSLASFPGTVLPGSLHPRPPPTLLPACFQP